MAIIRNGTPQAAWLSELKTKHPGAFPQEPVEPTPPAYPQAEYDVWKPLNDKLYANPELENDEAFMSEYTPAKEAWDNAAAAYNPLAIQYHEKMDAYKQEKAALEAAHQANTDIRYMPSYMQGYQEMLANAGLDGGPEKPNLADYQGHPWMQMYGDIVNPFDAKAPDLKDLDYYAKNFGIDTSVASLQNKFNSLTQQEYAQKNKEFQRSEDQYYQNMSAQNAQYQQGVQNAMSQALASGSSRGMQFANQFAAQNELAQQNSTGALELAQQRNDLKAQEAQAYTQNAVDAERTAYDRRANILNQAVTDRASEAQRYAADASVYAQELASKLQNYQYNIGLEYARHEADTQRAQDLYETHVNNRFGHYSKNTDNKLERDKAHLTDMLGYAQIFGQADVARINADAQRYVADKNYESTKYSVDNSSRGGGYSGGGYSGGGYSRSGGGYSGGGSYYNPNDSGEYTVWNMLEDYYNMSEEEKAAFRVANPSGAAAVQTHNKLVDNALTNASVHKKAFEYTAANGQQYYALPDGSKIAKSKISATDLDNINRFGTKDVEW